MELNIDAKLKRKIIELSKMTRGIQHIFTRACSEV